MRYFHPLHRRSVIPTGIYIYNYENMTTKIRSISDLVRVFSKRFNPSVIADIENGKGPYSLICHTGRKSGQAYRTPVDAKFLGDFVLITLPYGQRSDWLKNVLAGGGCEIIHRHQIFTATLPQILTEAEAKRLLPPGKKVAQIKDFLRLEINPARME
jgi:deazaflavin-dependent oxidoreductase (nitroreductase family)